MRVYKWLRLRFYLRRAHKLEMLTAMLGHDFAVQYGSRRGWIEKEDGRRIFLKRNWVGRW